MFNPQSPPEWSVARWLNSDGALSLPLLRGKVIVLSAFQMLCPGCVSHGLPQTKRIYDRFSRNEVAVIGLHTVFEHKDVMTPKALEAFVHEYRWPFPIGIDEADPAGGPPKTMAAYEMRGTPTLLVFDREGRLRRHYFGQPDDILLGAEIMAMVLEQDAEATEHRLVRTIMMPGHDHGHDHHHGHGDDHHHDAACGCGHDHGPAHQAPVAEAAAPVSASGRKRKGGRRRQAVEG